MTKRMPVTIGPTTYPSFEQVPEYTCAVQETLWNLESSLVTLLLLEQELREAQTKLVARQGFAPAWCPL